MSIKSARTIQINRYFVRPPAECVIRHCEGCLKYLPQEQQWMFKSGLGSEKERRCSVCCLKYIDDNDDSVASQIVDRLQNPQ